MVSLKSSLARMHGPVSVHFQSKRDITVHLQMKSDIASQEHLEYFTEHAVSWCKRDAGKRDAGKRDAASH